jgi:hypothetical protein
VYFSPRTSPDGTYTLTIVPTLKRDTDDGKHVSYLTIIASDGRESHSWIVFNQGQFAIDFALFVDAGVAFRLLKRLRDGETIMFPGTFTLEFLKKHLAG